MADREKIIKGLKLCVVTGDFCGECPYDGIESCIEKLHDDAIALLKEKEHEKMKVNIRHRNNDGYCPSCGKCIVMDFCPNNCGFCGQSVKWGE